MSIHRDSRDILEQQPRGALYRLATNVPEAQSLLVTPTAMQISDASASARHAIIQGDPSTGQAFVEDAGSRNGTFVNEQKVPQGTQRQLHDNDRLRLGSITLVVKLLASG